MNAILGWLTSPEWAQVVKTLLHSLWQAGLVALVLGLLLRRIASPAWRYRFALGSLGGVLIAAVVSWAVLNQLLQRPEPFPQTVLLPDAPLAEQGSPAPDLSGEPIVFRVAATKHAGDDSLKAGWTAWLALVWILGALVMVIRAGVQVAGAERLRRSCKPLADERVSRLLEEAQRAVQLVRRVRVAVTDKLTSPAVVGVLVPTLILPLTLLTALTPEQLRFVLLHELAHIRRGDYFANLFQLFMEALLFFNPAVWWISHLVRREREACCDALAIKLSGAPVDYAKTLVQVAENVLSPAPAVATAFGDGQREPSSLSDRVQRLLVPDYRPALRLTWRAMLAALLVGGALLFLSALGARNVVGAVTSNVTENALKPTTNVVVSSSSSAEDSKNDSFTMPKWEGSWKKRDVQRANSGAQGMSMWRTASDEEVLARLEQMKFDRVFYQKRKLSAVLAELEKALLATDPDKQGFRLSLPPDWEYPAKWKGIDSVVINMPVELRSTTMRSVLDAIVSGASRPIRYKFGGFCANFEMKFDAPTNMWFQRFDVNRKDFLQFIGVTDSLVGKELQNSSNSISADWIGDAIREHFLKAGLDLRPPNAVFYKLETGQLYVYAPKEDLEIVEKLLKDNAASNQRLTGVPCLDPSSKAGMFNWTVDGEDKLAQMWFRNRAGTNKAGPDESFPKVLDKGRQGILQRLDHILLDNYSCDKLPLKEFLRQLSERTRQLDPTKEGINFVIRPEPRVGTNPVVDTAAIPITISTNHTMASLGSIIYFVVKNAATPIEYSIEDTQVVFYLKPGAGITNSSTSNQRRTSGRTITLTDGGSTAQVNIDAKAGMFNWTVDRLDQLNQQWFWYRVGSSSETSTLPVGVSHVNKDSQIQFYEPKFANKDFRQEWIWSRVSSGEIPLVQMDWGAQGGIANWTVGGVNHLNQRWFRYRVGSEETQRAQSTTEVGISPERAAKSNDWASMNEGEIDIEGGDAIRDAEGRLLAVTNGVRAKFMSSGLGFTADSVQFNPVTGYMISARNIRAETKDGTRIQGGNINWFSETNNIAPRQRVRIRLKGKQIIEFPEPTGIPPQPPPNIKKGSTNSVGGKSGSTTLPRKESEGMMLLAENEGKSSTPRTIATGATRVKRLPESTSDDPVPPLYNRMFKIEPSTLYPLLGLPVPNQIKSPASSSSGEVGERLREWLELRGVDLQPPKTLFFNERLGQFLVHAPMKELGEIESLVQALNVAPQIIDIKARFIEVPAEQMQSLLRTVFTNAPDPGTNQFMETLSEARTKVLLSASKTIPSVDVFSCRDVTTLSGHQAQLQVVEVKTFGNGTKTELTNGATQVIPDSEAMSFGVVVDVIPTVMPDGHTIKMRLIPTVNEFVGYDDPGRFYDSPVTPRSPHQLEGRALASDLPAIGSRNGRSYGVVGVTTPTPRYRVRRVTTSVSVWDGQTVLFGNIPNKEIARLKDKVPVLGELPVAGRSLRNESGPHGRKQLILLITPTIVDLSGDRVYPGVQVDNPELW